MAMQDKLEWKYIKPPVDEAVINRVERLLGIAFPSSYRACVFKYQGARPNPNEFMAEDGRARAMRCLLPLDPTIKGNIVEVWGWISDQLAPGLVPFADDAFGNYLCFDFRNGVSQEPAIVFWDHEHAAIDMAHSSIPVAASFAAFLDLLVIEKG